MVAAVVVFPVVDTSAAVVAAFHAEAAVFPVVAVQASQAVQAVVFQAAAVLQYRPHVQADLAKGQASVMHARQRKVIPVLTAEIVAMRVYAAIMAAVVTLAHVALMVHVVMLVHVADTVVVIITVADTAEGTMAVVDIVAGTMVAIIMAQAIGMAVATGAIVAGIFIMAVFMQACIIHGSGLASGICLMDTTLSTGAMHSFTTATAIITNTTTINIP